MKKKLFNIILLLLVACNVQATNFFLLIQSKEEKKPIENVSIIYKINNISKNEIANKEGKLIIQNINFPLTITCNAIGYEEVKIKLNQKDVEKQNNDFAYTISLEKKINQIQDIVITGQNKPILATQSIYKVNTIGAKQIAQRGAVSLNDVLSYEMNNFVSNDNILGTSLSIGGIGGQNVKILLNGIPVTGRENGNIDLGQINLSNVKRIETIQGPMSVIYGSNALGGVINIITNQANENVHASIKTYLESIGKYNISGNMSVSKKNHSLQFSLARNFFKGWTPNDSEDRFQLWKPKTQYIADLQYNYQFKNVKLNYYTSFLNEKITNKGEPIINAYEGYAFDEYYRTQRIINALGAEIKISNSEKLNLLQSYSIYKRTKNRFKKDLVSLQQTETESIGDQDTTQFNTLNLRGTLSSNRFKNIDMLAGYEYNYEVGKSYKLADEQQYLSEIGLFASSLFTHKKLNIQPSFRYIYNNKYKSAFTPALHTKIDLNKTVQIRGSYARGFRTPTMKELYLQFIDQNHTILGNPDLKPEISDHYEIAIEKQFKHEKSTCTLSINTFHNEIKNMISLAVFNNHGVLRKYSNIAQYNNWMANTQAKWQNKHITFGVGVGFIYVEKSSIIPQHNIVELTNNISYSLLKYKTTFNFNYKFNSKQPVITVDNQFLYTNPIHIANCSVQKSLFKNTLTCQVGLKNLLNIQNSTLNGSIDNTGSAHTSSNGMQLFPARSVFVDISYRF